jgi:phage-related protein
MTSSKKAIKNFFANLWTNIKNIFKGVGNWFRDTFNAAVTAVKNVFSSITGFFSGIWNKIKDIFSKVGSTIANAISGTVKKAINGVLSMAVKVINGFISAINFAIGIINAIPGVNIKKLNMLQVPALAKGGIVDSATLAVIGEQGKEAVVPLENNTEWIDKLAERISAKTGGGKTPIVLEVDGRVFAKTSIDLINARTRQTGKLGLNIV